MKEILDVFSRLNNSCVDCWELGPPPDTILTIPPPPMPTFLMLQSNDATNQTNQNGGPCPLLCDWTTGQGVELNELSRKDNTEEDTWFVVSSVFFAGTILLAILAGIFLFKCRQMKRLKLSVKTKTFNHRTYESIFYPANDNQDLWATMTPKGKPHHIVAPPPLPPRINQVKSFENSAFNEVEDYPTVRGRPRVSFPIKIENANIPPLNYYPNLPRNYPSLL